MSWHMHHLLQAMSGGDGNMGLWSNDLIYTYNAGGPSIVQETTYMDVGFVDTRLSYNLNVAPALETPHAALTGSRKMPDDNTTWTIEITNNKLIIGQTLKFSFLAAADINSPTSQELIDAASTVLVYSPASPAANDIYTIQVRREPINGHMEFRDKTNGGSYGVWNPRNTVHTDPNEDVTLWFGFFRNPVAANYPYTFDINTTGPFVHEPGGTPWSS